MKNKKTVIISIVLVVLVAIILVFWLIDYSRVKSLKKPLFCLKNSKIEYIDGYVDECIGTGYKVYNYNRGSMPKIMEFGPFYIKLKE